MSSLPGSEGAHGAEPRPGGSAGAGDPRDSDLFCAHRRVAGWSGIPPTTPLDADRRQLASLLADARLLLWTARVRWTGSDYDWALTVAPESLESPLLEYTAYRQHGLFWHPAFAPDYAATEQMYRSALARGLDHYDQQFRITYQGRTLWLEEAVRIRPLGPDEWHFSGLTRDITEQKLAREAERRANDELRRLLQHAQCMLWHATVTDPGTGELAWELGFLPSGLQRQIFDRIDARSTTTLYDDFDVPQLSELHARSRQALETGAPGYQQEFVLTRRRDGQTYWLREHVAILPDGDRRWKLSGVMIDVTPQKIAELARRDTELQFQRVLEQVDCIVWHARLIPLPDGGYDWIISAPTSRLFRRLFHGEPVPPVHFWTPENTLEFAEMDRRWRDVLASGGDAYEQEFRFKAGDQTIWLHENVSILDREGDIVHLAGVVVDITERKAAEVQLMAEKERLAVMLRAMDEAVATVDIQGVVTFLNRAAEDLLQVRAEEVIGRPLNTLATLQSGRPPHRHPWPFAAGQSVNLPTDALLVRPHGPTVRVEGCVAPLHDPASRPIGALVVLRDVTERHLLQLQLQRASTLESVGLLAGGIAHDFNNILTALLANLTLADMDAPAGSELADHLREARAATDRAAALARQLLTFAKGGDPLLTAVDLADVIEEVTRFTLRGTRVVAALDLAADLWPARADRGQLAQIIQNLVLNAAQSMSGGTIRIAARNEAVGAAGTLAPGDYVHVSVTDFGVGIPPEALEKLFTPYFTTKPDGHGLGLAVVFSIVKKHRGSIDVRSTPGQGTTFELRLPAATGPCVQKSDAPASAGPLRGRVLVMDDEESILQALSLFLRRLGLEVQTTTDGAQAVEVYRTAFERGAAPDVVIMDLTVPGRMGGRDAIAELRRIDPDVRAIVASGYSTDPVLARYQEFGFRAMAAKPYDLQRLARQIGGLIGRRD